jgi:formylglycine-generating enzyme required for sulfatase activity
MDLVEKNGGLLIRENWLLVEAGKHLLEFVRIPEIEGLWLSSTPVTVSQFKAYRWSEDVGAFSQNSGGDDCPVVGVSWFDCEEYCKLLSQDKKRVGKFRLPFSREWLIAAQVNPSDEFWFGNTIEAFPFFGWYYANSERSTNPVRRLVPSPRGLFDLHGNVWEWCADIYTQDGINLSETKQKDAVVQGDSRILRGGSWSDSPNWCSLQTTSNPHWPADRGFMFGARIALELHVQSHD